MRFFATVPDIAKDCWTLVSAEERHAKYPDTFLIPDETARRSLKPGDAAKLLFDIETRDEGTVHSRAVDRMWVIIKEVEPEGYIGVLDSDPGEAEDLNLTRGDLLRFTFHHICDIDHPPAEYLLREYGNSFALSDDK